MFMQQNAEKSQLLMTPASTDRLAHFYLPGYPTRPVNKEKLKACLKRRTEEKTLYN